MNNRPEKHSSHGTSKFILKLVIVFKEQSHIQTGQKHERHIVDWEEDYSYTVSN